MDKKLLKILDNVLNNQKSTVDSDVKEMFSSLDELKEFQSIYIKFENDNFKKLKDFLNSSTKFDLKFSNLIFSNNFSISNLPPRFLETNFK